MALQELFQKISNYRQKSLVQQHSGDIEGEAVDLDPSGALIISDGVLYSVRRRYHDLRRRTP